MNSCIIKKKNIYIGVCLTFNIVEEDKNLEVLKKSLGEAARLHLRVVCKKNLPDSLLNRYAPEKYWKIYFEALNKLAKQRVVDDKIKQRTATSSLVYPSFIDNKAGCLA